MLFLNAPGTALGPGDKPVNRTDVLRSSGRGGTTAQGKAAFPGGRGPRGAPDGLGKERARPHTNYTVPDSQDHLVCHPPTPTTQAPPKKRMDGRSLFEFHSPSPNLAGWGQRSAWWPESQLRGGGRRVRSDPGGASAAGCEVTRPGMRPSAHVSARFKSWRRARRSVRRPSPALRSALQGRRSNLGAPCPASPRPDPGAVRRRQDAVASEPPPGAGPGTGSYGIPAPGAAAAARLLRGRLPR